MAKSLPGMELMKGVGLGPLNIGNVLDTMGFVKKAWGAMNAPTAFMPTIDVEELKKRIVDLQAVEQWLVMNLSMIQSSIQALEVQRATIETLKGVSKGFMPEVAFNLKDTKPEAAAPAVTKPVKEASKDTMKAASLASPDPGLSAGAWLEFLQSQFNQVAQAAMTGSNLLGAKKSTKEVVKTGKKAAPKAGPAKLAQKSAARRSAKASFSNPGRRSSAGSARTNSSIGN
jgi:hypothetical protein